MVQLSGRKFDDWPKTDLPTDWMTRLEEAGSDRRRQEIIAVGRLFELLGLPKTLQYDSDGRPFIPGHSGDISITHSRDWAAVGMHTNRQLGIDIETVSTRARRIAPRFMNPDEYERFAHNATTATLVWAAKESLIKCYGRVKDWRNDLVVSGFEEDRILVRHNHHYTQLGYRVLPDDNRLVWCLGKPR